MPAPVPIARVAPADLAALGRFVFARNRGPDGVVRCLHADQGDSAEDHARELLELPAGESLFLAARDGPRWLGSVGAEFDPALGRAWVRAPLAADDDTALAAHLLHTLTATLAAEQPAVRRLDAFVNPDDALTNAVFATAGWERVSVHHVMRAPASAAPALGPGAFEAGATAGAQAEVAAVVADDPDAAAAMPLHEALFPTSYLPPAVLLASLDERHRLFVARAEGRVAGYLYAQHRLPENEGYVDYLGVADTARGRGLGRALLGAALHWLAIERGAPFVDLTVRTDRSEALALYERAGFVRRHAGVQWRLERAPGADDAPTPAAAVPPPA